MSVNSEQKNELQKAFDFSEAMTRKSGSNLWFVSQFLSDQQRVFFNSCYCSMRIIDDFVDEDFLKRDSNERHHYRSDYIDLITLWKRRIIERNNASFLPQTFYDVFPRLHWCALDHCLDNSNIGTKPWLDLWNAMHQDLQEERLTTWDDFQRYCMGATVAPAEVFLYVLALENNNANQSFYVEDGPLIMSCAQSMAIFCYLVHIMRDLNADILKSGQILTLPSDLLTATDLKSGHALNKQKNAAFAVYDYLIDKTKEMDRKSQEDLAKLQSVLPQRSYTILKILIGIYQELFKAIQANRAELIAGDTLETDHIRSNLLNSLVKLSQET